MVIDGAVGIVYGGTNTTWFDGSGPYTARLGSLGTLTYGAADDSSGTNEYVHTSEDGTQTRFFDFDSGLPAALRGTFKSLQTPGGERIVAVDHETDGRLKELRRSVTEGFDDDRPNLGLMPNVGRRRRQCAEARLRDA